MTLLEDILDAREFEYYDRVWKYVIEDLGKDLVDIRRQSVVEALNDGDGELGEAALLKFATLNEFMSSVTFRHRFYRRPDSVEAFRGYAATILMALRKHAGSSCLR